MYKNIVFVLSLLWICCTAEAQAPVKPIDPAGALVKALAPDQDQAVTPPGYQAQPLTAILGAFSDEITLLLGRLEQKKERVLEHIRFTEGVLNGRRVVVVLTGIGKVNAAITTTLVLEHFHPAQVIFSGIAGGVDPELSPGDLVIGTRVAYHDYGTITPDSLQLRPTRNPFTFRENPLYFPCDSGLLHLAVNLGGEISLERTAGRGGPARPRVVSGTIVTGDVFVASRPATEYLRRHMDAEATEMEGAAVAQTCWQQGVPFLVIRSLSDDAGSQAYQDVKTFYQVAARNSATLVIAIVGQLARN